MAEVDVGAGRIHAEFDAQRTADREFFAHDIAAYDAAAPDREVQKLAISEEFIEQLCALGDEDAVRSTIERYRAAGATDPIVTGVLGTDYESTLRAAAPVAVVD